LASTRGAELEGDNHVTVADAETLPLPVYDVEYADQRTSGDGDDIELTTEP